MKKNYDSPVTSVYVIVGQTHLLDASPEGIMVDKQNKVSNSDDIGFVKGNNSSGSQSVWDDDWSKQN